MSNSWWENISFWFAVEMEAKSKFLAKHSSYMLKFIWQHQWSPLSLQTVMAEKYSLTSGYLYLTCWTTAHTAFAQRGQLHRRMLPSPLRLSSHCHYVILGILPQASSSQSTTSLLLQKVLFYIADDEWWQLSPNLLERYSLGSKLLGAVTPTHSPSVF